MTDSRRKQLLWTILGAAVFFWAAPKADAIVAVQQQVNVGGRDIDAAVAELLAVLGMRDAQHSATAEDDGHQGFFLRRDVNHDENCGGHVARDVAQDGRDGFEAAG